MTGPLINTLWEDQLERLYWAVVKIKQNNKAIQQSFHFGTNPQDVRKTVKNKVEIIKSYLKNALKPNYELCYKLLIARILFEDETCDDYIDEELKREKNEVIRMLDHHPMLTTCFNYMLEKFVHIKHRLEYLPAIRPCFKRLVDFMERKILNNLITRTEFKYICQYILKERLRKFGNFSGVAGYSRSDEDIEKLLTASIRPLFNTVDDDDYEEEEEEDDFEDDNEDYDEDNCGESEEDYV